MDTSRLMTRDHVVVSMVTILFYTLGGDGRYPRGGIYLTSHLPPVILFPVKFSFFQPVVGEKLACYWCSGGVYTDAIV